MQEKKLKILLYLTKEEINILFKAIDYYSNASALFEYGENIENCLNIRNKIINNIEINS